MNRRSLSLAVAALALVALVAAAVPALGDETVAARLDRPASASALAKAKRALGLSRQARRSARLAHNAAANAGDRAEEARARANAATALGEENRSQLATTQGGVREANARIDALKAQVEELAARAGGGGKVVSAEDPALVSTSSPTGEFEALGGPSVHVTVPPSGLIEVWAQVAINDDEGGAVGLFEDGHEVDGIAEAEICGDDSALIDASGGGPGGFALFATPPVPGVIGCTSAGAPAPVLLSRPPGPHTYELRYAQCSCGGAPAEFKDRVLRVAPRS
ncbi:MAG TPA: hypothetical protein VHA54_10595 [Solirubrobacterales bacterium]|nr:hypothetical protein [Solirubrobacterales bacterium]